MSETQFNRADKINDRAELIQDKANALQERAKYFLLALIPIGLMAIAIIIWT
jgi:hypothetical protein